MDEKIIFTDGSARGNPGPGGWGAIVATDEWVMELGGMEEFTTNNRMELWAAISALDKTLKSDKVTIYTDSVYVLSGASRWVFGWQKNNWKTAQNSAVLNVDLWEKMLSAMAGRRVDWQLLKGHSGIPANERCDAIATSMADKKPTILYFGARQRYGISLDVPGQGKNKRPSRVYAHSYVSMIGGIIEVYKTWEECYGHVSGVSGALYKKSRSPEDEANIIAKFKKIAESRK